MKYALPKIGQRVKTRSGVCGEVKQIIINEFGTHLWIEDDGDEWNAPDTLAYDAQGWRPLR